MRQAAKDNDHLAMLTTLGMALHATQDFCTVIQTGLRLTPDLLVMLLSHRDLSCDQAFQGFPQGVQLVIGKYPEDRKGVPAGAA